MDTKTVVGRPTHMRITKKFLAAGISAALLVGAPVASAQTSAQQGYSQPGGQVQTTIESGGHDSNPGHASSTPVRTPERVTKSTSSSKLPFTGLDLILVVGAGGILLALGLGMRRLSRSTGIA
jgi:hypothetical protein